MLNSREQYYIQYYDSFHTGYNETLGGDGRRILELPEIEICEYYLQTKSLYAVCDKFKHDRDTIKKVLYKYNVLTDEMIQAAKNYNKSRPVAKIDITTNKIVQIYPSVRSAELDVGNKHINDVCSGKRKTAAGYKWQYVNDLQGE